MGCDGVRRQGDGKIPTTAGLVDDGPGRTRPGRTGPGRNRSGRRDPCGRGGDREIRADKNRQGRPLTSAVIADFWPPKLGFMPRDTRSQGRAVQPPFWSVLAKLAVRHLPQKAECRPHARGGGPGPTTSEGRVSLDRRQCRLQAIRTVLHRRLSRTFGPATAHRSRSAARATGWRSRVRRRLVPRLRAARGGRRADPGDEALALTAIKPRLLPARRSALSRPKLAWMGRAAAPVSPVRAGSGPVVRPVAGARTASPPEA